jgi:hypothetical protein
LKLNIPVPTPLLAVNKCPLDASLRFQPGLEYGMSFEEIVEELPKLTAEEKERLRQLLNSELSWTEEEQAIDEGIRSREEKPSMPWGELVRQIRDKFGLK